MSVWLVAPPALWGVRKVGKEGTWSYFDLQKKYLGSSSDSFPGENLALRWLESACQRRGIPVVVVNAQTENHRSLAQTWRVLCDIGTREPPTLIGFTGTPELFDENSTLAELAKNRWPGARTVIGHDFATLNASRIIKDYSQFDYVIQADGIEAFPELAERLLNQKPLDDSPGLVRRDAHGRPTVNAIQPVPGFDSLPLPARGDLPSVMRMGLSASVFTSRGCPYRCIYCTTGATAALVGGKQSYRQRSIESVVEEICMLVRDYGIDRVTITDDLFLTASEHSRRRAARLAHEILRRRLKIRFMLDCRVDSIEPDLFTLLAEAGLRKIFVGVETADDEQLKFYSKTYKSKGRSQFDVIRSQIRIALDRGITVIPGILTYHPSVTRRELESTADLIDLCGYEATYQFWSKVASYPGTALWDLYRQAGYLKKEWPVGEWNFQDPAAEAHYRAVKEAAERDRWDFRQVRETFRSALERWNGQSYRVA